MHNIIKQPKAMKVKRGPQRPTQRNPLRIHTKWTSRGETWAYRGPCCRNPHSFCMQRKVTGVSAKPYLEPTLSYFDIAKKCNNMYVSLTSKKTIIPGYLSSEYFPHSDAATSLSKEPAKRWQRSDVDNTLHTNSKRNPNKTMDREKPHGYNILSW